jgi:hypothetical protein
MSQKDNILKELQELDSSLANSGRKIPFEVPQGYFESLPETVLQKAKALSQDNPTEELETISPFLAGMKKDLPYSLPAGYFDVPVSIPAQQTRVVRMGARKWMRYAAAAVIMGVLVTAGFLIRNNTDVKRMSASRFDKKIEKEIDKMSDVELAEFLEYSDAGLTGQEKVSAPANGDVSEMLEDIPVSELKEFIEETSVIGTEVMMN